MSDYNLEPGEFVIMQESSPKLGGSAKDSGERLDEVVLTNQCLILVDTVSRGIFSRERMLKRCPLSKVLSEGDVPQVFVAKVRDTYQLQIAFADETVSLEFANYSKRIAERWADAVRKAVAGNVGGIVTEDALPPEVAELVDGAKGFVGALFGGKPAKSDDSPKLPPRVTAKCRGCHAPISGRAGETVTCAYCDTKQTL